MADEKRDEERTRGEGKTSQPAPDDVKGPDAVKTGGIARTNADTEDVTRDTYGFEQPEPDKPTRKERLAEAERMAEEEGIPGIVDEEER